MRQVSFGAAVWMIGVVASIALMESTTVWASVSTGSPFGYRAATHNMYGVNNAVGMINHSIEREGGGHAGVGTLAHQRMREAGVGWVRYWISWASVEASPGSFHWEQVDHDIDAAVAQGLNVYVTIQAAPAWAHYGKRTFGWGGCGANGVFDAALDGCGVAGTPTAYVPFDPGGGAGQSANWRNFVRAAVGRYSDRVQHWGFWNEPDSFWFWPERAEPPCYDRTNQVVQKVIKPAREAALSVNPHAVIVGPEDNNPSSLAQFLRLEREGLPHCGVAPYGRLFDVISIHAYPWSPGGIPGILSAFKIALDGHVRREVWLTEIPAGSGDLSTGLSEFLNRGWISKAFLYHMRGATCGGLDLLGANKEYCPGYAPLRATIANNRPAMHVAGATAAAGHHDFLLLLNPNPAPTTAAVSYSTANGLTHTRYHPLSPFSRATLYVPADGHPGVDNAVTVQSGSAALPVYVEHADYWNSGQAGRLSQASSERSDTWYFAEGVHGAGFWTQYITAYNPSATTAVTITWRFLNTNGTTMQVSRVVAARGHYRLHVNTVPGVEGTHSTIVSGIWYGGSHHQQPAPIVAERTITWANDVEGHSGRGVPFPSTRWYFAEGSQGGGWHSYLLLMNPTDRYATVAVHYLLPAGTSSPQHVVLAPMSRATVEPPPGIAGPFGLNVTSIGAVPVPIVAERTMYAGPSFTVGHLTEGAPVASMRWMLSEGSTEGGRFYDPYILIANPSPTQAQVRLNYRTGNGVLDSEVLHVPAGARITVVPWNRPLLRNVTFATEVISETPHPAAVPAGIVVERAQYWSGSGGGWYGGHAALGIP